MSKLVQLFEADPASATALWRIASHQTAQVGDRIYLFKQGSDPRGIFGVGEIIAPPHLQTDRMLTLYFAPGASSMAAHIALHEVGAAFEARPLSFHQRENRTPAYLTLNPEGKVPTLLIDGCPLTEVAAILFYLARRFPAAELLPEGDEAEAQALSWLSFIASTLHPARRRGLDHAMSVYKIADARMAGSGWVLGRFSVADIHLFRLFWRLNASLRPPPDAFPNLLAHHGRMLARPAVQRTLEAEAAIGYELPA